MNALSNGQPCKINFSGTGCSRTLDVVFILDLSGSEEDFYDLVLGLTSQTLYGLPVDSGMARVGIVSYADSAVVNAYLDTYTTMEQLQNSLAFSFDGGRTNTQGAIRLAYENVFAGQRGDRGDVPNIAILLTDGNSNLQQERTIAEAVNARQRGVQMYVVAMGTGINADEINGMASSNITDHVVYAQNPAAVASAVSTLLGWLCQ